LTQQLANDHILPSFHVLPRTTEPAPKIKANSKYADAKQRPFEAIDAKINDPQHQKRKHRYDNGDNQ
jgi:hypothetical protein